MRDRETSREECRGLGGCHGPMTGQAPLMDGNTCVSSGVANDNGLEPDSSVTQECLVYFGGVAAMSSDVSSSASLSTGSMTPADSRPTRRNRKSWTEEEKRKFWKQKKAEKKERRRAGRRAKQDEDQTTWESLSDAEKDRRRAEAIRVHELRRQQEAAHEALCRERLEDAGLPRLVFDLSFAWCMSAGDTKSTVAQIKFSYSTLRRAGFPMAPVLTSLVGREEHSGAAEAARDVAVQGPLLAPLADFEGFRRFPFPIHHSQHWSELFPKERVVFLTADADDVLKDIQRDTVYVIGAFVDHNQHKLLSLTAAQRHGVRTARLPIKENIDVSNRCQILTINHVVDLLTQYLSSSGRDWRTALEAVLPVRRVHQQELGSRRKRRRRDDDDDDSGEREGVSAHLARVKNKQANKQTNNNNNNNKIFYDSASLVSFVYYSARMKTPRVAGSRGRGDALMRVLTLIALAVLIDTCFVRMPPQAGATTVHYHGTVYRGVEERQLREGGLTFSIGVSIAAFPTDSQSMKSIMAGILSDHVQLVDESGFPLREDTHVDEELLRDDVDKLRYLEEAATVLQEWRAAVKTMLAESTIEVSDDRETVRVLFAPVNWTLSSSIAVLVIPCLPFALFQQLEAIGIPDLPHNCLAGDPFVIRRIPFPRVHETDLGFLVTGKPIEVPIVVDPQEPADRFAMERGLRVVEGSTCLHTRNAFVRGSVWNTQLSLFHFTPYRGGIHSLCFAPFPDTVPLLQLKMLNSLEVAGPEGVSTDPPHVRAEVEFTGTIFGTNFTVRDTAVMTEELCSDFTSQNVFFVELQFISPSRMVFFGTFHKRGIYHVCYHRDGSPAYIRVSTLLVEKGSEVVIDNDTANVLIDQDVKLLTSASVKKLKVQNRGNLVLKQRSLNVESFFLWSGGTITGHGIINITGYGRVTTEGYETRQLMVPLYNYGEITIDVQRLSMERDGCIHNYGNLTLTVSSMGSEGISSIVSSSERNAIYNYPGATLRIITLQDSSFALLTNRFAFVGGVALLSGKITMTDVSNGVDAAMVIKANSVVTLYYAHLGGMMEVEENSVVFAMGGSVFLASKISGAGKVFVNGDGIVLDSILVTGAVLFIVRTPHGLGGAPITVGLYNRNVFGPGSFLLVERVNFITGSGRSCVQVDGVSAVNLDDVSFSGMVDIEIASQCVLHHSTRKDEIVATRYVRLVNIKPEAVMYLIDFTAGSPDVLFEPGKSRCVQNYVGMFGEMVLHGKVFLRGCLHVSIASTVSGTLATLREEAQEWDTIKSVFCGDGPGVGELLPAFCEQLRGVFEVPGYSGVVNRGETTLLGTAHVDVEEVVSLRGYVNIPNPIVILARRQFIIESSRLALEKGGVLRTPILVDGGLVDVFDPLMTEVDGLVKVMKECFVRLRGVPPPCNRFFKASGGIVAEVEGDEIFHCVDLKSLESNFSKSLLTNLPSEVPCPAQYIDYMREKWIFFSHIRSWPNFRPLDRSLSRPTIFVGIAITVVGTLFVFRFLLHLFGFTVHEFQEDILRPSPLQLTLTWNEFRTKPHNYLALAFYVMNMIQNFFIPFHPFLAVPFPHVTIVCLRNTYLLMPFHSADPDSPHRISFLILLWCLLTWVIRRLEQTEDKQQALDVTTNLLKIFSACISIPLSLFAPNIASRIADGISCSTILRHDPSCEDFLNRRRHLPMEASAYLLFFAVVGWISARAHMGKVDNDLRAKSTFLISNECLLCLQVSLWKILYYNPLTHVTVSFCFTVVHLFMALYIPPTPYVNINRIVTISVALRFPVYVSIYVHQLLLRMGWLSSCNQGTLIFFLSILSCAVGFLVSIIIYVVYVNLPNGSVGDPSIDALRRSIAQIQARIEDIKKAIPNMFDPVETENALNAVSRLRVELLEKQERYSLEVARLLYPFYYVHQFQGSKVDVDRIRSDRDHSLSPTNPSSSSYLSQEEMESFSCGPALGKGSYGTVYLGILSTGKLVAVKYINVAMAKDDELQRVKGEVGMLMDLCHPNVIRYYGTHAMNNTMMIFMEFAVGGSLTSILRKFAVLTEAVMQLTFENAYSAMFYVGSTTDIPPIPEDTSEACRHFLHRCFERDVAKRATAEELLQHEWLSEVPSRNAIPLEHLSPHSGSFEGSLVRRARSGLVVLAFQTLLFLFAFLEKCAAGCGGRGGITTTIVPSSNLLDGAALNPSLLTPYSYFFVATLPQSRAFNPSSIPDSLVDYNRNTPNTRDQTLVMCTFKSTTSGLDDWGLPYETAVITSQGPGKIVGANEELGELYVLLENEKEVKFRLEDIGELVSAAGPAKPVKSHPLKMIHYEGRSINIVMQSKRGPCPIFAVANALALQGRVKLTPDYGTQIKEETLNEILSSFFRSTSGLAGAKETWPARDTASPIEPETPIGAPRVHTLCHTLEDKSQFEKHVREWSEDPRSRNSMEARIAKLYSGMDLDVIFSGPEAFALDRQVIFFALFGLKIFHMWVIGSGMEPFHILKNLSYNQLTAMLTLSPTRRSDNDNLDNEFTKPEVLELARSFFDLTTSTQMTCDGYEELFTTLRQKEIAVLFWKDHFFTITKLQKRVVALLTDDSFTRRPSFVFASLSCDTYTLADFLDSNGELIDPFTAHVMAAAGDEFTDAQVAKAKLDLENIRGEIVTPDEVLRYLEEQKALPPTTPETRNNSLSKFLSLFPDAPVTDAERVLAECNWRVETAIDKYLSTSLKGALEVGGFGLHNQRALLPETFDDMLRYQELATSSFLLFVVKRREMAMSEPFVLPELYINPEFSWGPPAEEMLLDGEPFELFRKPDRSDRNDKPLLPAFDFVPNMRYADAGDMDGATKGKGKFQVVEDTRRLNAMASANKHSNKQRNNNFRRDPNRAKRGGRNDRRAPKRVIAILGNTVGMPETGILAQYTTVQLSKLPEVVPLVMDLKECALPLVYNDSVEKKVPAMLKDVDYRDEFVVRPATLEDTDLRDHLKKEDPAIPAIGISDEMLSLLLTANRSVHPWHLKVIKVGNRYLFSRPDREDNVDKQWVSETAPHEFAPSEDSPNESERITALGEESSRVHEGFIQAACSKKRAELRTSRNPFPKTQPRLYRYRRFSINPGTPQQYNLVVRCEIDAVTNNKEYLRLFGLLEQERPKKDKWEVRLQRKQNAAIIPEEFHNNSAKISRWIALSLLSNAAQMKIGLITRSTIEASPFGGEAKSTPDQHRLLYVDSNAPASLARHLNINYNSMWATANLLLSTIVESMSEQDGFIAKLNNGQVVVVEGATGDSEDDSDEEDESEEEEESDDESSPALISKDTLIIDRKEANNPNRMKYFLSGYQKKKQKQKKPGCCTSSPVRSVLLLPGRPWMAHCSSSSLSLSLLDSLFVSPLFFFLSHIFPFRTNLAVPQYREILICTVNQIRTLVSRNTSPTKKREKEEKKYEFSYGTRLNPLSFVVVFVVVFCAALSVRLDEDCITFASPSPPLHCRWVPLIYLWRTDGLHTPC
eukprot:gene6050-4350_t